MAENESAGPGVPENVDFDKEIALLRKQLDNIGRTRKRRERTLNVAANVVVGAAKTVGTVYNAARYGGAGLVAGLLDTDGSYLNDGTVIWGTAGLAAFDGSLEGLKSYILSKKTGKMLEKWKDNERISRLSKEIEDSGFTTEFFEYVAKRNIETAFVKGASETAVYNACGYAAGRVLQDVIRRYL